MSVRKPAETTNSRPRKNGNMEVTYEEEEEFNMIRICLRHCLPDYVCFLQRLLLMILNYMDVTKILKNLYDTKTKKNFNTKTKSLILIQMSKIFRTKVVLTIIKI